MAEHGTKFEVTIEKLVYGGEGLSRLDGNVIFTPYVLPGESVCGGGRREKPGLLWTRPVEILTRRAGARRGALPLLRALRRVPLPARAVRLPVAGQARDSGRDAAAGGEDRAARRNRRSSPASRGIIATARSSTCAADASAIWRRARTRCARWRLARSVRRAINDDAGGAGGDGARPPLAGVSAVDRGLHQRDGRAAQRAGDGQAGGAALLRLVRGEDPGPGVGRAGIYRRWRSALPGEQRLVFPGEPVSGRQTGGSGAGGRIGRDCARSVCGRGVVLDSHGAAIRRGDGGGIGRGRRAGSHLERGAGGRESGGDGGVGGAVPAPGGTCAGVRVAGSAAHRDRQGDRAPAGGAESRAQW